MKDFNAVTKNLNKINELGWFVTPIDSKCFDWQLLIYTPHGRKDYLSVSNEDFLVDLEAVADDFDIDYYIKDALNENPNLRYTVLFEDANYFHRKVSELYNVLKDLDEFQSEVEEDESGDTREESKESDQQGNKKA